MESEYVIFLGCSEAQRNFGGCTGNPNLLTVGATYEIEKVEVHSYHTKVWLVGVEGSFNSVCFEGTEEDDVDEQMISLLRKWMYEMGSLAQHDYDALCKETEKLLRSMNVNLDD